MTPEELHPPITSERTAMQSVTGDGEGAPHADDHGWIETVDRTEAAELREKKERQEGGGGHETDIGKEFKI